MLPEWSQWVRFIAWFFDYLFVEPYDALSCLFRHSPPAVRVQREPHLFQDIPERCGEEELATSRSCSPRLLNKQEDPAGRDLLVDAGYDVEELIDPRVRSSTPRYGPILGSRLNCC